MIPLNDLSRQISDRQTLEKAALGTVLESGYYMKGRHTQELEDSLSKLVDAYGTLAVANGTDALMLAMLGLGVSENDKVATVPNAGGYSSTAAFRIGAKPVMVDIDTEIAQMSVASLEDVLSKNEIKVVVVTHLYGQLADIESISNICKKYGAMLIEDCAQAIGASRNSRYAGSWGDAATFSFYPTKNLGAIGDGGAVSFKASDSLDRAKLLSQYGWSERYKISLRGGFNSRIDEIQAAILNVRMNYLHEDNSRRRTIVNEFRNSVTGTRRMLGENNESYVAHLAVMVTESRDQDMKNLELLGIATGIHYPILDHAQPAWASLFELTSTSQAENFNQQIVTLPCFPNLSDNEVQQICDALKSL